MIEIIPNWHPLFVHFPIALVMISTACFVGGIVLCKHSISEELFVVSKWTLWFAGLSAIATAYTGWLAYNTVAHDAPSHQAMTLHKNWALPTAGLIALSALAVLFIRKTWGKERVLLSATCLVVLSGLISITGYLGAESVYRYGIGVMSLPKVEGSGDHGSHSHGSEESHGDNHAETHSH